MTNEFSSFHTHTRFCDGKDDVETMCAAAYAKGLAAIGLSSHAPLAGTMPHSEWNMPAERLAEYTGEVIAARQRWQGKIPVYLGLELDYIKGLRCALDHDIQCLNLDYIIGSVHYLLPRGVPFTVDGTIEEVEQGIREGFAGDGQAMMHAYWDAVLEMTTLGGFDIVGHLDLVKKNNAASSFFTMDDAYMRRVEEVVRSIASGGFVVEASTGGLNRGHITELYPSLPILRLLRRYDVPVMISADAHNAHDLDGHYQTACRILLDAGYTSHVIFAGRRGKKPLWNRQILSESE